jgi:hypothetical protein
VKIVAILAARNEERFIGFTIRRLFEQGVHSYVIDNGSTDRTAEIVRSLLGCEVVGMEIMPYDGCFRWTSILKRKEQLHQLLGADWYIHHDPDCMLQAPKPWATLAEGFEAVDRAGDNALDFAEFLFMPTGPEDGHDNDRFAGEMRQYVHFAPRPEDRVIAWKNTGISVNLTWSGGHQVNFDGRRIHPQKFILRHYLALSPEHAVRKYVERRFDPAEVARGWHGKRATIRPEQFRYPEPDQLRELTDDNTWDTSKPLLEEPLFMEAELPKQLPSERKKPLRALSTRIIRRAKRMGKWVLDHDRLRDSAPAIPAILRQLSPRNLLVLGSGRSGTSMVTSLLRSSGYFMGFDMLGPTRANLYGYYEDTGVTEINNLLLRQMLGWKLTRYLPGAAPGAHRDPRALWHSSPTRLWTELIPPLPVHRLLDAYTRQQPFCFKDPRFSSTLPIWERYLPPCTGRIVVFRDPDSTVDSILRDAKETYKPPLPMSARWAYTAWARNYSRLLDYAGIHGPAVFVRYEDVLSGRAHKVIETISMSKIDVSEVDASVSRARAVAHSLPEATRCREVFERLRERAEADLKVLG